MKNLARNAMFLVMLGLSSAYVIAAPTPVVAAEGQSN